MTVNPRPQNQTWPPVAPSRPARRGVLTAVSTPLQSHDHGPRRRVAGAWRVGDPVGGRRFVEVGDLLLESGLTLPGVRLAYEIWGQPDEKLGNVILVEHALTGDSHVAGPASEAHPSPGWWDALLADGGPVDLERWCVIAFNVLGGCQGSTGPSSPAPDGRDWGGRFPALTIRDQVNAESIALDRLGIQTLAAVIGGSMGGMRALEWAVSEPHRVQRCIVLASTPFATADQIAWCHPQLLAIRSDPHYHGGDYAAHGVQPQVGLGIARRIAHTTYRTEEELSERFGRDTQDCVAARPAGRDPFAVESYLDHHAGKLARRFDANSYVTLTEAMNSHDVGRGRGGLAAALQTVSAECTIVAVDTDRLYVPRLSEITAAHLRLARYRVITSRYGHDGFLIEQDQVSAIISEALAAQPV